MKFKFNANIIRRRRIRKSTLFFGLVSTALLGYCGLTYLEMGSIPFVEKLVQQLGLMSYINWVYLGLLALFVLVILPSIYTLFKKKVTVGGQVYFDEENLKIVKGKDRYVIPEAQLSQVEFDLRSLPSAEDKPKKNRKPGGNFMRIPTTKGTFQCELDINDLRQKDQLLEMIEFLKIEHDVKVKVKER